MTDHHIQITLGWSLEAPPPTTISLRH